MEKEKVNICIIKLINRLIILSMILFRHYEDIWDGETLKQFIQKYHIHGNNIYSSS